MKEKKETVTIVLNSSIISLEYGNFCIDYYALKEMLTIRINNIDKVINVLNVSEKQFNKIRDKISDLSNIVDTRY